MMKFDHEGLTEVQQDFYQWIIDREDARIGKELGLKKPWTLSPIIQQYKFTNVRREDDRVTKWIKDNWRDPYEGHPNMWFAMCVARLFNWPDTLNEITFPYTLDGFKEWSEKARVNLKAIRDNGGKVFTGAYLVSTNGVSMDKIDYIFDVVLKPLWEQGSAPVKGETLATYHKFLTQFNGLGSFMAGQVVADLKYTPVLADATDWWDFAPLGPGSIRGLNRYFGRKTTAPLKQAQGLKEMKQVQQEIENRLGMKLDIHDVQNCMCETDKNQRVKLNEGRPRSLYNGRS
jgi:hypothetical protein